MALTDLIGDRIYPLTLPMGCQYPAIRYTLTNNEHESLLSGAAGISTATIQLDVYAATAADKLAVIDALLPLLDSYSGLMCAVNVLQCEITQEKDFLEAPAYEGDIWLYRRMMEVTIVYAESRPNLTLTLDSDFGRFEDDLFGYLTSALADHVEDRVYTGPRPQSSRLPAVSFLRSTGVQQVTLEGSTDVNVGTFTVTVWAEVYEDCLNLNEAVRNVLHGLSGTMGSTGVLNIDCEREDDAYEVLEGSEVKCFMLPIDFSVTYRRA